MPGARGPNTWSAGYANPVVADRATVAGPLIVGRPPAAGPPLAEPPTRPPWPPWPTQPGAPAPQLPFDGEADWSLAEPAPPEPPPGREGGLGSVPNFIAALATIGVFVVWALSQAGYPVGTWAAGSVLIVCLLAIALWSAPGALRTAPRALQVAIGSLAAFTAWSYLSILWAASPGDAFEGASRTLLYLAVFVLFASWRANVTSASWLLGLWTLGILAVGGVEVVRLATAADPASLFVSGRLTQPAGYPNAEAAQWLMAFWPAVALAGWPRLHRGLRGLAAGGAVALAGLALLSQSRGAVFALPLTGLVFFLIVPSRLRNLVVLAAVAAGVGVAVPALLHVGDVLGQASQLSQAKPAVHSAVAWLVASAVVVGIVVAVAAPWLERQAGPISSRYRPQLRRLRAVTIGVAVLAVVAGLVALGSPTHRIQQAWHSFTHGYTASAQSGSRLTSGLGSNRYDFYRVAWNGFTAHPLGGLGADNFQALYLRNGTSGETPRYPHSIELRALEQTGLIGALLLGAALLAALVAAAQAIRRRRGGQVDPAPALIAGAAVLPFAYWLIHGSFDWFWEFAGLGAPAFAMLGIACSLAPRRRAGTTARPRLLGGAAVAYSAVALVLAASLVAFGSMWLSQRAISDAVHTWTTHPAVAYADLQRAARLEPLSDQAQLLAGTIATREGDLARAKTQFRAALSRIPDDAYATLQLGALDSATGQRAQATQLLERAVNLAPRDPIARAALTLVRQGGTVDPTKLNQAIYRAGAPLAG